MTIQNYLFILLFLAAISFFVYNIIKTIKFVKLGRFINRFDNPWKRISRVINVGIGQTKILRDPVPGIMHALIFWGFLTLLTAVIEAIIQGFYSGFSLTILGTFSKFLFASQDTFGALVILSVLFALFRRYALHPKRLQGDGHTNKDAAIILFMILGVRPWPWPPGSRSCSRRSCPGSAGTRRWAGRTACARWRRPRSR